MFTHVLPGTAICDSGPGRFCAALSIPPPLFRLFPYLHAGLLKGLSEGAAGELRARFLADAERLFPPKKRGRGAGARAGAPAAGAAGAAGGELLAQGPLVPGGAWSQGPLLGLLSPLSTAWSGAGVGGGLCLSGPRGRATGLHPTASCLLPRSHRTAHRPTLLPPRPCHCPPPSPHSSCGSADRSSCPRPCPPPSPHSSSGGAD